MVVMCRRGTSVVKNLKFLTLSHFEEKQAFSNQHHYIYLSSIGELPCVTNTD